jgi:hypothetical protein
MACLYGRAARPKAPWRTEAGHGTWDAGARMSEARDVGRGTRMSETRDVGRGTRVRA